MYAEYMLCVNHILPKPDVRRDELHAYELANAVCNKQFITDTLKVWVRYMYTYTK